MHEQWAEELADHVLSKELQDSIGRSVGSSLGLHAWTCTLNFSGCDRPWFMQGHVICVATMYRYLAATRLRGPDVPVIQQEACCRPTADLQCCVILVDGMLQAPLSQPRCRTRRYLKETHSLRYLSANPRRYRFESPRFNLASLCTRSCSRTAARAAAQPSLSIRRR